MNLFLLWRRKVYYDKRETYFTKLKKLSTLQILVNMIYSLVIYSKELMPKPSFLIVNLCYNKHSENDRIKLFSCLTYSDFVLLKSGRLSCILSTLDKHKCSAPMDGRSCFVTVPWSLFQKCGWLKCETYGVGRCRSEIKKGQKFLYRSFRTRHHQLLLKTTIHLSK